MNDDFRDGNGAHAQHPTPYDLAQGQAGGSSAMGIEIPADLKELYENANRGDVWATTGYGTDESMIPALIERIANLEQALTAEKERHAYFISLYEPQHRQALEERDEARAELSRLRSQVEAYQKPVTDEEWDATKDSQQVNWRYVFDEIIASRQQAATEKEDGNES